MFIRLDHYVFFVVFVLISFFWIGLEKLILSKKRSRACQQIKT